MSPDMLSPRGPLTTWQPSLSYVSSPAGGLESVKASASTRRGCGAITGLALLTLRQMASRARKNKPSVALGDVAKGQKR